MTIQKDIEGFSDRDLLIEVYTVVKDLKDDISALNKQVHGNGQPGIKDRLAKLEERTSPGYKVGGAGGAIGAAIALVITKLIEKMT